MKTFKAKFFGSKNRKEQIVKSVEYVQAKAADEVESVLRMRGYVVINGLKIREEVEHFTNV